VLKFLSDREEYSLLRNFLTKTMQVSNNCVLEAARSAAALAPAASAVRTSAAALAASAPFRTSKTVDSLPIFSAIFL
jgi:hypothetical protein